MSRPTPDVPSPRNHVLLIGIDAYDADASLRGCVNDVDAIQEVLLGRAGVRPEEVVRLVAPLDDRKNNLDGRIAEDVPTLANLRAALARLASTEVGPGDRVFIYYSGHGTQIRVVGGDGAAFVREALLPTDFRVLSRRQYLFDWEINAALAAIASRTSAVTLIFDACCSGGATRYDFPVSVGRDRYYRIAEEYRAGPAETAAARSGMRGLSPARAGLASFEAGRRGSVAACQVVTACLDDERARETSRDGDVPHGELTRALVGQIGRLADDVTDLRWGRIWRAVLADVAAANPAQHPQITGGFARRVFGGPPESGDTGYGVQPRGGGYELDAGGLVGVTAGARLAIYGPIPATFDPVGSDEDKAARKGVLEVTGTTRSTAQAVVATKPGDLSPGANASAPFVLPEGARARLIQAGVAARLQVALIPECPELRAALQASDLLEVAAPETRVAVALQQRKDGSWAVTDDAFGAGETPAGEPSGEPTLALLPPSRALSLARKVMEHYRLYSAPLRLARECSDLPGALVLKFLDCNNLAPISPQDAQNPEHLPPVVPPEPAPGVRAPYAFKGGDEDGGGDLVAIYVENTSNESLYVTLIVCQDSGQVSVAARAQIPARSRRAFWEEDTLGRAFRLWLAHGRRVGVDRLVLIGTTRADATFDHLTTGRSFKDIIDPARGAGDRNFGGDRGAKPVEMWTSTVTAYRIEAAR